jgi:hypothetical protein
MCVTGLQSNEYKLQTSLAAHLFPGNRCAGQILRRRKNSCGFGKSPARNGPIAHPRREGLQFTIALQQALSVFPVSQRIGCSILPA